VVVGYTGTIHFSSRDNKATQPSTHRTLDGTFTIHFSSRDNKATLPPNYTFTSADNGVHTFTGLVLRKKGTQKITVTDTRNSSLTGSVTENVL
jgi:hypothetical protein